MDINWSEYDKSIKPLVFAWLDHVTDLINEGRIDTLRPLPFYARRELLTDEIVEKVAAEMEAYLRSEITTYKGYHRNAQGVAADETLITPGFDTMPMPAKRALVERYDELLQMIRLPSKDAEPAVPTPPNPWAATAHARHVEPSRRFQDLGY